MEAVERNRAAQIELYGRPLAELFGDLMSRFQFNQGRLAATIGLSAPMLSQLSSAQRVKIGNPAVLQRLDALLELERAAAAGTLTTAELDSRLAEIPHSTGAFSRSTEVTIERRATEAATPGAPAADRDASGASAESTGGDADTAAQSARDLRGLLRAVASGQDLQAAAALLEPDHPGLAAILTTYGLGDPGAAAEHLRTQRPLF